MQTVKLTSRREVAPAVYELLFTRPEGWTFEAGQFARIGLAADGDEPVFPRLLDRRLAQSRRPCAFS